MTDARSSSPGRCGSPMAVHGAGGWNASWPCARNRSHRLIKSCIPATRIRRTSASHRTCFRAVADCARATTSSSFPKTSWRARRCATRPYAVFFFNKFHKIFQHHHHAGLAGNRGGCACRERDGIRSAPLLSGTVCPGATLHDYFHHRGARPFDEHITVKTRWFTGLLEEIKVDLQTWLACREGDFIDARHRCGIHLLRSRLTVHPTEPDWSRNFDSGTGLLLLAMLRERGVVDATEDGCLSIDMDGLVEAANGFIADVEAIEALTDAGISRCGTAHGAPIPAGSGEAPAFRAARKSGRDLSGPVSRSSTVLLAFDRPTLVGSLSQAPVRDHGVVARRA